MFEWLHSLDIFSQVYFWIALVASIFLIVQIVLMLFSFGGGGDVGGIDVDGDGIPDGTFDVGTGISLFTVKGLTAFFTLGGWVGLLCSLNFPAEYTWVSVFPAFLCSGAAMVGIAFAMKAMFKLQTSGNLQKENVIGKTATVYVSIQPSRTGRGKITLTAQGQFMELDAVTDETEKLCVDEKVVIEEFSDGTAVVKRIKNKTEGEN